MRYSTSLLVLMFTFAVSPIFAQIVDPNVSISAGPGPNQVTLNFAGSSTFFDVTASPTAGFANVAYADTTVDFGRRWFTAEPGQLFSCTTLDNFQIIGSNEGGVPSGSVDVALGSDFYLAINTGGFDITGASEFDEFGWAQLNVDQNLNLTAVDAAFSSGCEGIVIGVPEPELGFTAIFLTAGLIAFARRKR